MNTRSHSRNAARTRPPLLAPGARVALVAPAGPLRDETELQRAVDNVRSFGWEPLPGAHALAREGYFAGTDSQRLADLQHAIDDGAVDAVWCLRGGYGSVRLLQALDTGRLSRHPKAFIGFSDITVLHAYLGELCDMVTFHGPTARAELALFSRHSLECAVVHGRDSCGIAPAAVMLSPGIVRAPLAGGNLALLASLCGTPFAPDLRGTIVVIEDVNEPLYRIDRMFQQLMLSGMLTGCAALVFGAFSDAPEVPGGPHDQIEAAPGRVRRPRLDSVLAEVVERVGVPALAHVPVGHIADQWTLPLGTIAELDTGAHSLRVLSDSDIQ